MSAAVVVLTQEGGGGAGTPLLGLLVVVLLAVVTVLLIRNMSGRIQRLPPTFEGDAPGRDAAAEPEDERPPPPA